MPTLKKHLRQNLILLFSVLFFSNATMAATDLTAQENYLRARVQSHQQGMDHSAHAEPIDKSLDFHGIFYGYLPCTDCDGIKTTMSLKQKNNYLIVTQPARDSSREYYEKGKYDWNEATHTLTLTPRNAPEEIRHYLIQDEGTIVQLNSDGSPMPKELTEVYTLRRSDMVKSREVHIH